MTAIWNLLYSGNAKPRPHIFVVRRPKRSCFGFAAFLHSPGAAAFWGRECGMAWIKIEHETPDKPEVIRMAEILDIDQDAVLGKLARLWIWADQQTIDGNALSVTEKFIDRHVHLVGFAEAMCKVMWLKSTFVCGKSVLCFPNFDRQNGDSAKNRALTAKRVAKSRNGRSVTLPFTEGEGEGEGEFPLSETRRDETALCDFFSIQAESKKWAGLNLGAKKQDRSLVLKICALMLSGKIPQDWAEQWREAVRVNRPKNAGAYLMGCASTKCEEAKMKFKSLLAAVKLPEEPT